MAYDYAGRVKYMVLDDVTGDTYEYGYFSYTGAKTEQIPVYKKNADGSYAEDAEGNWIVDHYETETTSSPTLAIRQADSSGKEITTTGGTFMGSVRNTAPGGVAYDAKGRVAVTVSLQSLTNVKRTAFDSEEMTLTIAGVSYPVSKDVQCYNKTTKTWFKPGKEGMEAARAYSDDLTVYYDRDPAQGGKIRLIVVP